MSPPTLTVNYHILGDKLNLVNVVNIEALETVNDLQEFIKAEESPRFDHVKTRAIQLWRVSIPGDDTNAFAESIDRLKLVDGASLLPLSKLSNVFPDPLVPGHVHIVVKAPPPRLALNYYILEDNANIINLINIGALETVRQLQEAIRAEESPRFDHVKAHTLELWKHDAENINGLDFVTGASLRPPDELSKVFPDPLIPGHVHIIVKPPPSNSGNGSAVSRSSHSPPQEFDLVSPNCTEPLETHRAKYMKAVPPASPSTRAQTQNFSELQSDPDLAIHCNRPQSAAHPTSVTLLHPIFGQFVDECETLRPKYEDNAFALEASQIISALYPSEVSRKDGILGLFERHKIPLHGCSIQGIPPSTDADTGFPFAIAEMEGSDYVEPYAQAAFYYLESTREHWAMAYPASPLPCIIVTVIGSCLAFAGAIWDHRPCVQVLSAAVPFHFHPYDTDLQSTAARHLGAFKRAVQRLRDYYADIVPRLANIPAPHDKLFPYPTCFTPLAGPQGVCDFRYSFRPSDERLVFFGNILGDNTGICIKFVRHYSSAVHQYFSNLGLAPRLLGLESLSGGWKMVIMDRVDQEYIDLYSFLINRDRPLNEELRSTLYDTLHTSLVGLHRAGFVHGDIRAPSIMISKNRRAKFLLLDFDWAGEIGMARYPPDVYRGERLWRPDGVSGGALITTAHDVQMLDHIFMADAPKSPSPRLTPTSSASSQAPSKRSLASDGSEARVSKRRREGM